MNHELLSLLMTLATAALFGSWHCAAMCGPIAAALATKGPLWPYHLGRGLSYLFAGIAAGSLGRNLFFSESLALRILLGLLLGSVFVLSIWKPKSVRAPRVFALLYRRLISHKSGALSLGLASVFLPCAWLWTFLAAAGATGSAYAGALVMMVLWASSLPALSAVHLYFRHGLGVLEPQKAKWARGLLAAAGLYAIVSHLFLKSL